MTEQPTTPETSSSDTSTKPDSTATPVTTPEQPKTSPTEDAVLVPRATINYVVIAVMFFIVGIIVGAVSFGAGGQSITIDEETIAQAVQDAFANVDIGDEVIQQSVQNALVDSGVIDPPVNMDLLADDDPFIGPVDAPITIVEFSAYACPFCGRHFNETMVPLLENYGDYIRYVYRDFPSINPDVSYPASFAANCALEQDMFWEYHDALFSDQTGLIQSGGGTGYLIQLASDISLNTATFTTCLTNNTYVDEVNVDFNAGVAAGITGTPSFFINGTAHSGARPYEYFEAIVQRELTEAGVDF